MLISKQVERFITVAEKGSISEAARVLYITQPALSKQLNTLETQLGFPLFERTKMGITLTPMGKSFYEDMTELIMLEENAIHKARGLAYKQENIIRMAVFNKVVELQTIQPGLINFAEKHPDAIIQYVKSPSSFKKKKEMLFDGLIDIFWEVIAQETHLEDSNLGFTELFEDSGCVLIAEDHPLAALETISIEDLYGWKLTLPQGDDECLIFPVLCKFFSEQHPQIQVDINDLESSDYLDVQKGDKLLYYGYHFGKYIPHVRVVPLDCDNPKSRFGFFHKANPSNIVRDFIQSIQAGLKDKI